MLYHENRDYDSGFPINATIFNNISFLAHWHTEFELILVCEGSLEMGINSKSQILKKGDIAICTSGDIHYYDSKNTNSTVLVIVFRPELIGNIINLLSNTQFIYSFLDTTTINKIGLNKFVLDSIKTCLENIYKEINQQNKHYHIFVTSYLTELIGLFLRHVPQSSINANNKVVEKGSFKIIQKAINYIENNYMINISLEDISEFLGINPFYFSKIFSKMTGITFKTYLNSIRIEKANNLLTITDEPIIDIAYECGFNSIRTFNRVFKTIKGTTPSSLR